MLPHTTTRSIVDASVSVTTQKSEPTKITEAPSEIVSHMTPLKDMLNGTSGSVLQLTNTISSINTTITSLNTVTQGGLQVEFIHIAPLEHVTKKLAGSIFDDRVSSQAIGYIGIAFIAIPIIVMFVLDLNAIYNHLRICPQNISGSKDTSLIYTA